MVTLTIDGKSVQIEEGKTVLDAAGKLGIKIPTLCYHPEVSAYGSCRICQVEVTKGKRTKLVASCLFPVDEGISVTTNNERITRNRKLIVELLLSRCPEVKAIQDLAKEYGVGSPRFRLKQEDCILCGLCVRVCDEVLGVGALSFSGRGTSRKVETPFDEPPEDCLGCGACTYVCPTGAIQMEVEARNRWRRTLEGQDRECRISRMGLVSHKICPNSFQCQQCEVDQKIEDTFGTHPAFVARPARAREPVRVDLFTLLPELRYSRGHIWAKALNGKVRIGLDDFASQFIGNVNEIKLPTLNAAINPRDTVWEVTNGERPLSMLSPFRGRVVDINPLIQAAPSLIARDPYHQGWILTLEPSNPGEDFGSLLSGARAQEHLKEHVERLHQRVEKELGITVADGSGGLIEDLPNILDDEEWNTLVKELFLA
jgi:bidirectional [NiFe] hydrogenase diaphorase subunit